MKRLRTTEQQYKINENKRIKFVETSGRKFIDHLKIADPYQSKCSPADKCLVCKSSLKSSTNCKISNVGYSITCNLCRERNLYRVYEGETGRNSYIRGKEHLRDLEKKNEKSIMYKHIQADHKEEEKQVNFEMKVVGRFKDAMSRQIDEAVRINNREPKTLLNSKNEYNGPVIRRKVPGKKA